MNRKKFSEDNFAIPFCNPLTDEMINVVTNKMVTTAIKKALLSRLKVLATPFVNSKIPTPNEAAIPATKPNRPKPSKLYYSVLFFPFF